MKLLGLLLFLTVSSNAFCQSIARNERDDLTGVKVVYTEWEILANSRGVTYFYRINVIDRKPILDLQIKVVFGNLWTVSKGSPFVLQLANDSIVKLETLESSVSYHGAGQLGLWGYHDANTLSSFTLSNESINAIIDQDLVLFKIGTSEGYLTEPMRKKHKKRLSNTLKMLWPRGAK